MPRRKQPAERLERKKQHLSVLNRILADVRLMPSRALFGELLALYLDFVKTEDQELVKSLLLSVYGNPRQIRLQDSEDPSSPEGFLPRRDAEAMSKMRNIFEEILNPGEGSTDA